MPTISQLASDTVPNDNDLLVTVDVNAGTTKNITREDFFTGAPLPAGSVDTQALGDTGWVDIEPSSAYTSSCRYRVVAGMVYLVGSFSKISGNVSSGDVLGELPDAVAPSSPLIFVGIGTANSFARTSVEITGEMKVLAPPSSTVTMWRFDNVSYPLG